MGLLTAQDEVGYHRKSAGRVVEVPKVAWGGSTRDTGIARLSRSNKEASRATPYNQANCLLLIDCCLLIELLIVLSL